MVHQWGKGRRGVSLIEPLEEGDLWFYIPPSGGQLFHQSRTRNNRLGLINHKFRSRFLVHVSLGYLLDSLG